jgi:hypothetical protein
MVIDSSGGQDFKRIFHAGFHDPDDWPKSGSLARTDAVNPLRETQETNYFAAISSCITQILNEAQAQRLESIAFPLIGCGLLPNVILRVKFNDGIEVVRSQAQAAAA